MENGDHDRDDVPIYTFGYMRASYTRESTTMYSTYTQYRYAYTCVTATGWRRDAGGAFRKTEWSKEKNNDNNNKKYGSPLYMKWDGGLPEHRRLITRFVCARVYVCIRSWYSETRLINHLSPGQTTVVDLRCRVRSHAGPEETRSVFFFIIRLLISNRLFVRYRGVEWHLYLYTISYECTKNTIRIIILRVRLFKNNFIGVWTYRKFGNTNFIIFKKL